MKRTIPFIFVGLLLLAVGLSTSAAQIIVPPPCPVDGPCGPGRVQTNPEGLVIDYHRVDVDISNQIAETNVDMQFTNNSQFLAEGTFVFPLPRGAAVDQLTMWVDGVAIDARILPADEAREIYNEIVRQYRDPALLEYVGTQAIQANVFPIPPEESRRVQIRYSNVVEVDNGLLHYVYPLNARSLAALVTEELSVNVSVDSNEPISNIYSPSHSIAINREDANHFSVGFEAVNIIPDNDFSLFYGIDSETINVNLLSYRESADESGFFMLLVQPPIEVPEEQVLPKDVIVVLDQSGSMFGEKWDQAREAAAFVLNNLNSEDRFNLLTFSTGVRTFSNRLESPAVAQEAIDWINGLEAIGGTDINLALTTALDMLDDSRTATILFLTDGVATEGEIETDVILNNVAEAADDNVRIFTFGVGDDVDTFLLDAIVRDHSGAATYVRPGERIDEDVASLYNKVSAPVLTNVELEIDGARVSQMFPAQMTDLFAGNQLTVVGRFTDAADDISVRLSGEVNGEAQTFVYDGFSFPERAGGEPFIARLWATRQIGDLLNQIRLNGENPELVDSVVNLSVRYGIITPYTSFLIEEDDILSQTGRAAALEDFEQQARSLSQNAVGGAAVDAAEIAADFSAANAPLPQPTQIAQLPSTGGVGGGGFAGDDDAAIFSEPAEEGEAFGNEVPSRDGNRRQNNVIETVGEKTFILQNGVWTDTTFEPDTMTTEQIVFLSDEYFALLDAMPEIGPYFALGDRVIVVIDGTAYEVVAE